MATRSKKPPVTGNRSIADFFRNAPPRTKENPLKRRKSIDNGRKILDTIVVLTPTTDSESVTSQDEKSCQAVVNDIPQFVEDSQKDEDVLSDSSDLSSLDDIFPQDKTSTKKTTLKLPKPRILKKNPLSMESLLKEQAEMRQRQEKRAQLATLLQEDVEEFGLDDSSDNVAQEEALGKDTSDKLKAALNRIGGDMRREGGYHLFSHAAVEREFDPDWIRNVEWLSGFEGNSRLNRLIVDEMTRNDMVESGFVKDMLTLREQLPQEVCLWSLEHLAFERNQNRARVYSEIVILTLNDSNGFLTVPELDKVLRRFGVNDTQLDDKSKVKASTKSVNTERDGYGLLLLACILGGLPAGVQSVVRLHAAMILCKMALDSEYGEALGETVEAQLATLIPTFDSEDVQYLITILVETISESATQFHLLTRLPFYHPILANFRETLAKGFLDIPPSSTTDAFLHCLRTQSPFTEVKRDMANEHARNLKYAMLILDVAISHPPPDQRETTKEIIKEMQSMHRRIIDGRAAFLVRTEAKEVISRVWMRLDYSLHNGKKRNEHLYKFDGLSN